MKKLPGKTQSDYQSPPLPLDSGSKEEFRPPSPAPGFTEADLLLSVLKRLGELEEKVEELQAKPSEMPSEKEELLNAAVCRVDALEAELITAKKVNYYIRRPLGSRAEGYLRTKFAPSFIISIY